MLLLILVILGISIVAIVYAAAHGRWVWLVAIVVTTPMVLGLIVAGAYLTVGRHQDAGAGTS